jgi:hypothetical protein
VEEKTASFYVAQLRIFNLGAEWMPPQHIMDQARYYVDIETDGSLKQTSKEPLVSESGKRNLELY